MSTGARALAVLLPTETLLLDAGRIPPTHLHVQAIAQLLTFATTAPGPFKEATAKLDAPVRDKLEAAIRQAIGARASANAGAAKPQISLKAF